MPTRTTIARAVTTVAALALVAGCSSQQDLPAEPPVSEPGYPQLQVPVVPEGPDTGIPPGPQASAAPPTTPAAPSPTAAPTPAPTPSATPEPDADTPDAAPAPPNPPAPATPAPTTPSATPAPPPSPSPSTAPVTLATQTWQPQCGAGLSAPAVPNLLSVGAALPTTPTGGFLQTEAVLTSGYDAAVVAERYVASVTIARDGVVVSTWAEGQDAGPPISLSARGTLVVPVAHDLVETCPTPGEIDPPRAPEPPGDGSTGDPGSTGTTTPADGTVVTAAVAPAVSAGQATPDAPATAQPGPLPAGSYTAVVAVHLVRDGGQAQAVVASSGVLPFTITS